MVYRLLADAVVVAHFAYVLFVVLGLVAIVVGLVLRRHWARNFWLRNVHLAMIGVVVIQAWVGRTCPLTLLENRLRTAGGQAIHEQDFIEYWVHRLMFFRAPPIVFIACYTAFGLVVLATFLLGPPRWPRRKDGGRS
ncbi:MAG TPA: DUF2784 domain-containing protein [Isosphaeraceae bacterium]|jgi:hypothetical protein|nr:DUF2784 domain-containing protein [Isosphaeraceae bacterium]